MKTLMHTLRAAVMAGLLALTLGSGLAQVPDTLTYSIPAPLGGGQAGDRFGNSVAISGTLMVTGSPEEVEAGSDSGSAYVYNVSSGSPTVPVVTLSNPDPTRREAFGHSVAISGTRVVVAAPHKGKGAFDEGRVYVFDLSGTTPGVPVAILNNPAPTQLARFGWSISISGTRVVVGDPFEDTEASNAGRAYVYDLSSGSPTVPVVTLINPTPAEDDGFGDSVAISGTRVVVGASGDHTGPGSGGSAYVYDLSNATPSVPVVTLNNPSPAVNDGFGSSVAISGTRIVVGASRDDTGAPDAGSAYVYDLSSDSQMVPVATLNNPAGTWDGLFGSSTAISGTLVVVGAYQNYFDLAGSAYVYDLSSGTPSVPVATLNNPSHSPANYDQFGISVAIDGTTIAVGAPLEDKGYAYVFGPDTMTLSPTLISPASSTVVGNPISVSFSLPEAALPGSVKLSFGATVLTLAASLESAGTHSFAFSPANPTASPEVAAGGAIADGSYTVTLSYQDAPGNPAAAASAANVTVDRVTLPPTLFAPAANAVAGSRMYMSFSLPEAALPGSVTLSFGTTVLTLASSLESAGAHVLLFDAADPTASPRIVSGGAIALGVYTVTLSYRDAAGNAAAVAISGNVEVKAWRSVLASTGGAVPGAGMAGSGVPAGAVWSSFGVPSVNALGRVAFLGSWKAGGVKGEGIFLDDALVVAKGGAAPGLSNATFAKLGEPLLAPDGAVAWVATFSGAVKSAIFLDADGSGPGLAIVVAQTGLAWKKFTSVALGGGALAFTGTQGGRAGLWVYDRDTATVHLAAQEGMTAEGSTIRGITALVERPGSPGNGRGVEGGRVAFRLALADKTSAIAVVTQSGTTIAHAEGDDAPGFGTGAVFGKLGLPTLSLGSGDVAFLGTVKPGTTTAIFAHDGTGLARIVAAGDVAAGGGGALFSTLHDPVAGQDGQVVFTASLEKGRTPKITAANDDGIWASDSAAGLHALAREGAQAADAPAGAKWKKFTSLALPEGFGPLFVATMSGVGKSSETGLWATDSLGALRLLLREGDALGSSNVRKFSVLTSVLGSPAQTRSFSDTGSVIVRATDAKGAEHLVLITVP